MNDPLSISNGKTNIRVAMLVLCYAQYMKEIDKKSGAFLSSEDYTCIAYKTLENWNIGLCPKLQFNDFFQALCLELNYVHGSMRQL
jgi:hypothetical protein